MDFLYSIVQFHYTINQDFSTLINGIEVMMLERYLSRLDDQLYEFIKPKKRCHVQEKGRERTIVAK